MTNVPSPDSGEARALLVHAYSDGELDAANALAVGRQIPQAPRVVDLTQEGFPLLGARIDVIGAAPVPPLVYGRRRRVISLSAVPDTARGEGAAALVRSTDTTW